MKDNLYLIAIISLLFFFFPTANALQIWDGTSSEAWTNGSGTEADPYLIEMPAHLAYLSAQVAAGHTYEGVHFLQTDDFDLNSKTWTPIGTSTYMFSGVYDGGGKYISKLKTSQYGLFGITENAQVKNISFLGTYTSSSASVSAPLIGTAQGTTEIVNCHNLATSTSACAGLIAKAIGASISLYKCSNRADITASTPCGGGLIASVGTNKITIEHSYNNGTLSFQYNLSNGQSGYSSVTSLWCGGLIGKVDEVCIPTLRYCYNKGDIKSSGGTSGYVYLYVAGLIGYCSSSAKGLIIQCYNISDFDYSFTNTTNTYYKLAFIAGLANGNCDILGSFVRTSTNLSSFSSTDSYARVTRLSGELLGGAICESCYAIGVGDIPTQGSNVYHNSSTSTAGIYKSDIAFKDASMIPLLNTMDEFFTMDYEGINDGYPILTWQKGIRYNINATCDPTRGTVKGGGEYAMGNTVTLTATPKYGSIFVGWSDGNTDNPRTITVEGDANYIAQFTKSAYTIYVNQDGTSYIE